jgi:ATP-binding cassette subfamily B protein
MTTALSTAKEGVRSRIGSRWFRALAMAGTSRKRVITTLLMTTLLGALGALEPWMLKEFLDGISQRDSYRQLGFLLGVLALVGLAREGVGAICNGLTWRTRIEFQQQLLDATVGRLHSLPLSYHRSNDVGGIMTRLDRGIQGVVQGLSELTFNALPRWSCCAWTRGARSWCSHSCPCRPSSPR